MTSTEISIPSDHKGFLTEHNMEETDDANLSTCKSPFPVVSFSSGALLIDAAVFSIAFLTE